MHNKQIDLPFVKKRRYKTKYEKKIKYRRKGICDIIKGEVLRVKERKITCLKS